MDSKKRGQKEGEYAAKYFGSEFQANPGSSRSEYLDSAAWYYGAESFRGLTPEQRKSCLAKFQEGIEAEKRLQ